MAYDNTKYQLSHLLQDAWYKMGQLKTWSATGGSATTIIDSVWAGVEEQLFEDDDPALIYGTAVVVRDAAGLGGSPEGEYGMITDYDSSIYQATIDTTLSAAVAAGDLIGIASPLFPVVDMVQLANIALQKLGDIDLVDTSLVVVSNQTEYTLPSTIRSRPTMVRVQTLQTPSNNMWEVVPNPGYIPATAGSNWTLVLPQLSQGYSIEVTYRGVHPKLKTFSDDIQNAIHPELAVSALVAEAYQWYNNQLGGSNPYFVQRENKAIQDLEQAMVKYPIHHIVDYVPGMVHWGRNGRYVPLTSDQRE